MAASAEMPEVRSADKAFDRVVVAVDPHDPRLVDVTQAARLVNPDGWLELFCAVDLMEANLAGWSAGRLRHELERDAEEALRRARDAAGRDASTRLVNGPPARALLHELESRSATLAVVGTRGDSRWAEILVGGVTGELLHDARCSVCVARPPADDAPFPQAIVAGVDGSPESALAARVARHLADRFAASLAIVTALGGKAVDRTAAAALGGRRSEGRPVSVLLSAGREADLLVVGNRGLHGLRSLGSVSERVAHRASCSVLVVRST